MQPAAIEVALPEPATPAKRRPGRPPLITLPVVLHIAQLIAKGLTEEQACLRVGVNHGSFRTAKHRSPEFDTAIKEAQANYLDESLDLIGKGGRGWQGRAWILERRHGEQFRRTSGMEVTAHIGPFSAADLLMRKPLHAWTANDVEQSVGAWKLLKKWPKEQLEQLHSLYESHWGPYGEWTDEQLEWAVEIGKCMHGNASTPALPEQASPAVELVIG
jgi:hypothetical protein